MIVDGNPLEDILVLADAANVKLVMIGGKILKKIGGKILKKIS